MCIWYDLLVPCMGTSYWKKTLTCFCCFCVDSNFLDYENLPSTNQWELEVLIPNNVGYVRVPLKMPLRKRTGMNLDLMVITFLHFLGGQLCCELKRRKHRRGGLLHLTMHQDSLHFLKTFHLSLGTTIQRWWHGSGWEILSEVGSFRILICSIEEF